MINKYIYVHVNLALNYSEKPKTLYSIQFSTFRYEPHYSLERCENIVLNLCVKFLVLLFCNLCFLGDTVLVNYIQSALKHISKWLNSNYLFIFVHSTMTL